MRGLLLAVLAFTASLVSAQQLITTQTSGSTFGNALVTFEIKAQNPIMVYRVGVAHDAAGPFAIQVWVRPGGIGAAPPSAIPMDNWHKVDTAYMEAQVAGEIYQIPVDLNHILSANQKLGVCLVRTTGSIRHYTSGATTVANDDVHITPVSYNGFYAPSANPEFAINQYYGGNNPTWFHGSVWYHTEPTLTVSTPSLDLGRTRVGVPGTVESYTVAGALLGGPTSINAPAGAEISFNPTGPFSATLSSQTFPGHWDATVYVRIKASAPAGPITGSIVHSAAGISARNVAVSGEASHILMLPAAINLGTAVHGWPGTSASLQLSAASLSGATTVTVPSGFELAAAAAGPWEPSLQIVETTYNRTVFVRLTGATPGAYGGAITAVCGTATGNLSVSGTVVPPGQLLVIRNGPESTVLVDNDAGGVLLDDFTLMTVDVQWTLFSLEFAASGTADEQAALSSLKLYEDHPSAGVQGEFDPEFDTLATAQGAAGFDGPDGVYVANIQDGVIGVGGSRRYFLIADLAGTAIKDQTFRVEIASVTGTGEAVGVPTTGSAFAAQIYPDNIRAELHGPLSYTTVLSGSQGIGAQGHVICDVTIAARNGNVTINSLTFTETGTMHGVDGISHLCVYMDNGNGTWNGPVHDVIAVSAPATGFDDANGIYQAMLTPQAGVLAPGESRRFYLVAKLAGTAGPGQTLRVAMTHVNHTAAMQLGIPTQTTSALTVTLSMMTASAGPANPAAITRQAGEFGFRQVIGQFRLSASLGTLTVVGVVLSTGGSGDWEKDLRDSDGVCLYMDNQNGRLDPYDTLLFSGAGKHPRLPCVFNENFQLGNDQYVDVWIVVNARPNVGVGLEATFFAQILEDQDVAVLPAGSNCMRSTPLPDSAIMTVLDVGPIAFSPMVAPHKGGAPVTITGQGFAMPVSVTIGGMPCPGQPTVSPDGTQILGLTVPEGSGKNLPIVLEAGGQQAVYLNQSFTYSDGIAAHNAPSGGCTSSAATAGLALLLSAMFAALALHRRFAHRQ